MANWNLPTITSGYLDFVTQMNDKFVDAATLLAGAPTNLPNASIRYNRTSNIFEEWDLTTWNPKVIGLLGGGTGSNTAAGARTNLGLGSMATQNSNAVNITGGSISGVNFDASGITAGVVALARGGTGASLSLGASGWTFVSNGTQMVMDSGMSIAQLNASNLAAGTIPVARFPATVAFQDGANIFTRGNQFNQDAVFAAAPGPATPTIKSIAPCLNFYDTTAVANQHYIRINITGNSFYIQQVTDNYGSAQTFARIQSDNISTADGNGQFVGQGTYLTNLNANNLGLGTVPIGRLGAGGTPNSGTFLRGDNVWAPATGGSGGTAIPSGMISAFDVACPAGWTRYAALDNRFPLGSTSAGAVGGSSSHYHSFDVQTDSQGAHAHGFNSATGTAHVIADTNQGNNATYQMQSYQSGIFASTQNHTHHIDSYADVYNVQGSTDGVGGHAHRAAGSVSSVDQYPPWYSVVYCRKD